MVMYTCLYRVCMTEVLRRIVGSLWNIKSEVKVTVRVVPDQVVVLNTEREMGHLQLMVHPEMVLDQALQPDHLLCTQPQHQHSMQSDKPTPAHHHLNQSECRRVATSSQHDQLLAHLWLRLQKTPTATWTEESETIVCIFLVSLWHPAGVQVETSYPWSLRVCSHHEYMST